jgi:regulator of RNase E activity RraA
MIMQNKKLTGKIARENIRHMSVPRPSPGLLDGFRALPDASGVLSDVMDELGITGVIGASLLRPTIDSAWRVGLALTVRNMVQREHVYVTAKSKVNQMAEFEAHNLAQPDDFVVIQGVSGISNMGGISAQTAKRQGEVGAIVEGGIRDVAHSRSIGFAVWSTEVTPVTGKWRIQTVEINGDIEILGVRVSCGDIVYADSTGVCFIPIAKAAQVLEKAQAVVLAEEKKCKAIDDGVPVADLPKNA